MHKCDLCDKPATVHEVTVRGGVKHEKHLCEEHARQAGIALPGTQPINQLLTQFVISQASKPSAPGPSPSKAAAPRVAVKSCPGCGMSFAQFRQHGRLGCAHCYSAFEHELTALIERAQSGGANHCGKAPRRSGEALDQHLLIQRLARELEQAVAAEQYERAAQIRDRMSTLDTRTPAAQVARPRSRGVEHGGASA